MILSVKETIQKLRNLFTDSTEQFKNYFSSKKDSKYDKTQFDFSVEPAVHDLHHIIYFRNHVGIYGNSNVRSAFNKELTTFIAEAITLHKEFIFNEALNLIEKEYKNNLEKLINERNSLDQLIYEIKNMP